MKGIKCSINWSKAWLVKQTIKIGDLIFCNKIWVKIAPTCVFPVPGGPWIIPISLLRHTLMALNCYSSKEFINDWGYLFSFTIIVSPL